MEGVLWPSQPSPVKDEPSIWEHDFYVDRFNYRAYYAPMGSFWWVYG